MVPKRRQRGAAQHGVAWRGARSCARLLTAFRRPYQGDVRAAYQMALMYTDGVGVPLDHIKALTWLQNAVRP
jgi:TPR repeat protein